MHTTTPESYVPIWAAERNLTGATALYISTPISTGSRFAEWYRTTGSKIGERSDYDRAHRAEVILPNVQDAHRLAEVIRCKHLDKIVIEPNALAVPTWTQEDYIAFWCSVLKRYVNKVVFAEGWEYSEGCTAEYVQACKHGITCFDAGLRAIFFEQALQRIGNAADTLEELGQVNNGPARAYEALSGMLA